MTGKFLDRDAMLRMTQAPTPVRVVDIPDLGPVRVRMQRAHERERLENAIRREAEGRVLPSLRLRAMRAAVVLVDEADRPLFDANNAEDLASLAALPWVALDRIIEAGESFPTPDPEPTPEPPAI